MKLKITFSLRDMYVSRESDLPAHFDGPNGVEFRLWMRELEHQGNLSRQLCCDILADVTPPPRALETLLALRDNRLLLDDPIQEGLPQTAISVGTIVDLHGNIRPNWIVNFELLPSGAKPWFTSTYAEYSKKLQIFIKQLRWYQNSTSSHQPFASVGAVWSIDHESWHYFPTRTGFSVIPSRPMNVSTSARLGVGQVLRSGYQEPISHDLLREAGDLAQSAPRSALLVAFAALETAVKLQLNLMLPHASALVDKMPSPSLSTLFQEVLPRIIESQGSSFEYFPLETSAHNYLKKWVAQRNQVTHGVKYSVDVEGVKEFVKFAKDILYLLDYLNGHEWAVSHLECDHWNVAKAAK
ncbi:hypothetical protein K7H22_01410 [Seohaeicola saemankumensis]|uniref:hypothetical protein n=1 Tax=Seohaeicola saemankumensis TaxID=481181 RepID=UPI001E43B64D|nr:hypothetical protein [Seohaeicola saemankumensis]MCD1624649.1 hypothetical protein [Seohaeicola saemankumensis]